MVTTGCSWQFDIGVLLGSYSVEKEFTVIPNLTVGYLLGADFLKEHCTFWIAEVALSQSETETMPYPNLHRPATAELK